MVKHSVTILSQLRGGMLLNRYPGCSSYAEAKAFLNAKINELSAKGYTVKQFTITSLRVASA